MSRPKAFDPDTVLHHAMQIFWERGYEATSVQDLVDGMGINRFSLYSTFGGKHQLFMAALERYRLTVVDRLISTLEQSDEGLAAIQQFFMRLVEAFAAPAGQRGCLLTNTAVECAPHDPQAASQVHSHVARLEAAFAYVLQQAQRQGTCSTRHTCDDLARFLAGSALGLGVLAKTAPGRPALEGYVAVVLSALA
jgi:TetR/AcrR family transcriptional repressor of nem operon